MPLRMQVQVGGGLGGGGGDVVQSHYPGGRCIPPLPPRQVQHAYAICKQHDPFWVKMVWVLSIETMTTAADPALGYQYSNMLLSKGIKDKVRRHGFKGVRGEGPASTGIWEEAGGGRFCRNRRYEGFCTPTPAFFVGRVFMPNLGVHTKEPPPFFH